VSGKPGFFLHVIITLGHRGNESGEIVHHFQHKQSSSGLFSLIYYQASKYVPKKGYLMCCRVC